MSITVTALATLTAAGNGMAVSGQALREELHTIEFGAEADVDATVPTNLSHVVSMSSVSCGTSVAVGNSDRLFIKQAIDATKKCIVVASSSVPISRCKTDAAGTLIAANHIVKLIGY